MFTPLLRFYNKYIFFDDTNIDLFLFNNISKVFSVKYRKNV